MSQQLLKEPESLNHSHTCVDLLCNAVASLQLPRPKLELALPYGAYKLVRADGNAVERGDKHPFCMSRVYYDANERPEEVRVHTFFRMYRL